MATFDNITLEMIRDSGVRTEFPEQVKIKYREATELVVDRDNIPNVLGIYLTIENSSLTPLEFVNKVRDELTRGTGTPTGTPAPAGTPATSGSSTTDEEERRRKKEKAKKVGKIAVKTIAIGVAIALALQGGYCVVKNLLGLDDTKDIPEGPQTAIVQFDETYTPIATEQPTIGPISDVNIPNEQYLPYINRASEWINMSEDQYLRALESQTIACQMNMIEISNFLEGNSLDGEKHITHIENTFYNQSPDFCVVEYFNQLRNDVVNAAYDTKNRDNTRIMLEMHMREIYAFINNEYGVILNTSQGEQTFYWNNMTDEARNAVLDLFYAFTLGLPRDHVIQIGNASFVSRDFASIYEAELNKLVFVKPENRR